MTDRSADGAALTGSPWSDGTAPQAFRTRRISADAANVVSSQAYDRTDRAHDPRLRSGANVPAPRSQVRSAVAAGRPPLYPRTERFGRPRDSVDSVERSSESAAAVGPGIDGPSRPVPRASGSVVRPKTVPRIDARPPLAGTLRRPSVPPEDARVAEYRDAARTLSIGPAHVSLEGRDRVYDLWRRGCSFREISRETTIPEHIVRSWIEVPFPAAPDP